MNNFPHDCCDDTADLFTHYLYQNFGIDSIGVDGEYYDSVLKKIMWALMAGNRWWLVDLTGDQFNNDPSVLIKAEAVYVGKMDDFHRQFKIRRQEHSCGIDCLCDGWRDRMYNLYKTVFRSI